MLSYLIAGLGNIGEDYSDTRHNIGFDILDEFSRQEDFVFESKRYAFYAQHKIKNRVFHIIKPTTFMNRSGRAVRYWLEKAKVPDERLLILVDDVALPLGRIRLRSKGSDGGHNGLIDIVQHLGTTNFPRLRFGIGNHFFSGQQVQYVLGKWTEEEKEVLENRIPSAVDAIKSFAFEGISRAMTRYNKSE